MIIYIYVQPRIQQGDDIIQEFRDQTTKYRQIYSEQLRKIKSVRVASLSDPNGKSIKDSEWYELKEGRAPFISETVPRSSAGVYVFEIESFSGIKSRFSTLDMVYNIPAQINQEFTHETIEPFCNLMYSCEDFDGSPEECIYQCVSACRKEGKCEYNLNLIDLCFMITANEDDSTEVEKWTVNGTDSTSTKMDMQRALERHWASCQGVGPAGVILGLNHYDPGVYVHGLDRFAITTRHAHDPGFYFFTVVRPFFNVAYPFDLPTGPRMPLLDNGLILSFVVATVCVLHLLFVTVSSISVSKAKKDKYYGNDDSSRQPLFSHTISPGSQGVMKRGRFV